jgi:hypothetical protein
MKTLPVRPREGDVLSVLKIHGGDYQVSVIAVGQGSFVVVSNGTEYLQGMLELLWDKWILREEDLKSFSADLLPANVPDPLRKRSS